MITDIKEILEILDDLRREARQELSEIQNHNCFGAGYEAGKIDIINEIKAFIKDEEYEFGKDH
jgi:hypothetical protein